MAHSKKDGRKGGGHRAHKGDEVWSKRCKKVDMWNKHDPAVKKITHHHERRVGKEEIKKEVGET